ncbi:MAG TPA: alpha/beta hydrolase [Bryobacteraceae bacterium]|nr:alpha/beta hydrolase [Bryobacteraceae bacterium]
MRLVALFGLLVAWPAAGEYAEVHGLKMYYEVHGEGRSVVLLHGGMSTIQFSFAAQIPALAHNHRVIALEQMGHGHTADIAGRELSYAGMAEDTFAFLVQRGIRNADLLGFSDGGQIALRLAFTHPEMVRRVVVSGVGLGALSPERQTAMRNLSPNLLPKAFREEYDRVSPDGPAHWPAIFEKVRAMWSTPGWGVSGPELATIKARVLLVFGDRDFTGVEEAASIFHGIPGAQLCILPGTGHGTFRDRPEWLNPVVLDFLDRN